jgi:TetR/AcrR family transcriptional regulator, transcriptional repressor for nem operon
MARPREFDETQALNQARELFWRDGFAATSLIDLLDAMAISKSSFYETFGSKHELFLRALADYQDERAGQMQRQLGGDRNAREAIEDLFRASVIDGALKGCMTCNEAMELGPSDPSVAAQVGTALSGFAGLLEQTIVRGQQEGSIGSTQDAASLARVLSVSLSGLQVMIRARTDRARLDETVESILQLLN